MATRHPSDETDPVPPDAEGTPAAFLQRLSDLCRHAQTTVDEPLELYHRHAVTVRAEVSSRGSRPEVQVGREEGLALRVHHPTTGETTFAASSGYGPEVLDALVGHVRAGYAHRGRFGEETPWQATEDRVSDADDDLRLPSSDELTRWLQVACGALPVREAEADVAARVEAATVIETWVATGGRLASRSRVLCWAVAQPRDAFEWGAGPLMLSSRSWGRLAADGWATVAADRVWPAHGQAVAIPSKVPLIFSPEASATLVTALVGVIHGVSAETEVAVGPGWRVRDDPFVADAVMGRAFDDACFDTHARWLADGHTVVGAIGTAGNWRRASYRDVPRPLATHVVVDPPATTLPPTAVMVTGVRLHALEPNDWAVELRGGILENGEPGAAIDRAILRTSPRDLAVRCVAGLGEAQPSWRNATTPALVFEGLVASVA